MAPITFSQTGSGKSPQFINSQRQTIELMNQIASAQRILRDQGLYYGDIDGTMNSLFHKALRDYQALNQLYPTGRLDRQTMLKLGIITKKEAPTVTVTVVPGSRTNQVTLSYIWSKAEICQLQEALRQNGFDPGNIDGVVGPKTKNAIADFQRLRSLNVSGNLDRETEIALGLRGTQEPIVVNGEETLREKPNDVTPNVNININRPPGQQLPALVQPSPYPVVPEPEPYYPSPIVIVPDAGLWGYGDPNMGIGMASVNEDIRQAQIALKNRGFDPGSIDGMLKPQTQDALRAFQAASNLPVTGTFDGQTQAALGITVRGTSNPDFVH
jgi:peptidoglycan hydrolase-like protein with peptidoglycan-binding domain